MDRRECISACANQYFKHFVSVLIDILKFAIVFGTHSINYLIWLIAGREKSFENDVVLITGSGGYLGTQINPSTPVYIRANLFFFFFY